MARMFTVEFSEAELAIVATALDLLMDAGIRIAAMGEALSGMDATPDMGLALRAKLDRVVANVPVPEPAASAERN
jgi:hypothetical protein